MAEPHDAFDYSSQEISLGDEPVISTGSTVLRKTTPGGENPVRSQNPLNKTTPQSQAGTFTIKTAQPKSSPASIFAEVRFNGNKVGGELRPKLQNLKEQQEDADLGRAVRDAGFELEGDKLIIPEEMLEDLAAEKAKERMREFKERIPLIAEFINLEKRWDSVKEKRGQLSETDKGVYVLPIFEVIEELAWLKDSPEENTLTPDEIKTEISKFKKLLDAYEQRIEQQTQEKANNAKEHIALIADFTQLEERWDSVKNKMTKMDADDKKTYVNPIYAIVEEITQLKDSPEEELLLDEFKNKIDEFKKLLDAYEQKATQLITQSEENDRLELLKPFLATFDGLQKRLLALKELAAKIPSGDKRLRVFHLDLIEPQETHVNDLLQILKNNPTAHNLELFEGALEIFTKQIDEVEEGVATFLEEEAQAKAKKIYRPDEISPETISFDGKTFYVTREGKAKPEQMTPKERELWGAISSILESYQKFYLQDNLLGDFSKVIELKDAVLAVFEKKSLTYEDLQEAGRAATKLHDACQKLDRQIADEEQAAIDEKEQEDAASKRIHDTYSGAPKIIVKNGKGLFVFAGTNTPAPIEVKNAWDSAEATFNEVFNLYRHFFKDNGLAEETKKIATYEELTGAKNDAVNSFFEGNIAQTEEKIKTFREALVKALASWEDEQKRLKEEKLEEEKKKGEEKALEEAQKKLLRTFTLAEENYKNLLSSKEIIFEKMAKEKDGSRLIINNLIQKIEEGRVKIKEKIDSKTVTAQDLEEYGLEIQHLSQMLVAENKYINIHENLNLKTDRDFTREPKKMSSNAVILKDGKRYTLDEWRNRTSTKTVEEERKEQELVNLHKERIFDERSYEAYKDTYYNKQWEKGNPNREAFVIAITEYLDSLAQNVKRYDLSLEVERKELASKKTTSEQEAQQKSIQNYEQLQEAAQKKYSEERSYWLKDAAYVEGVLKGIEEGIQALEKDLTNTNDPEEKEICKLKIDEKKRQEYAIKDLLKELGVSTTQQRTSFDELGGERLVVRSTYHPEKDTPIQKEFLTQKELETADLSSKEAYVDLTTRQKEETTISGNEQSRADNMVTTIAIDDEYVKGSTAPTMNKQAISLEELNSPEYDLEKKHKKVNLLLSKIVDNVKKIGKGGNWRYIAAPIVVAGALAGGYKAYGAMNESSSPETTQASGRTLGAISSPLDHLDLSEREFLQNLLLTNKKGEDVEKRGGENRAHLELMKAYAKPYDFDENNPSTKAAYYAMKPIEILSSQEVPGFVDKEQRKGLSRFIIFLVKIIRAYDPSSNKVAKLSEKITEEELEKFIGKEMTMEDLYRAALKASTPKV